MVKLSPRYSSAVDLAREAHLDDVRKGTDITYLSHLLVVSALVLEHGGDEDQAIAALLHDIAEDAGGEARLAEIERRFGPGVESIVRACSDSLAEDPTQKAPWWERKVAYVAHLAEADPRALLISAADKLHNTTAMVEDYRREGEALWRRFNAGRPEQLWYQQAVAEVLAERLPDDPAAKLVARLQRTVSTLIALIEAQIGADQVAADLARGRERAAESSR